MRTCRIRLLLRPLMPIGAQDYSRASIPRNTSLDPVSHLWKLMSVRKVIAVFLLACFGILLPSAASPLRVCLLEQRLLIAEVSSDANCCSDCNRETDKRSPCCMDLEALPDASAPQPSIELPPVIITDIPVAAIPPLMPMDLGRWIDSPPRTIRGPTSPSAYRAVLSIWRL